MSEPVAIDVRPLTARALRRTSPRCSRRAATRSGAGAPTSGSAVATGRTRRRPAIAPSSKALTERDAGPRPRRLPGRPCRRLGQPRRRARTTSASPLRRSSLRSTTPRSGRSSASSCRASPAGRASRRPSSTRRSTTPGPRRDDPRGLPGRGPGGRTHPVSERLPRHAHDVRAGRLHGRRAPPVERHQPGPPDRPTRPVATSAPRTTSSVAASTSSSVRVDIGFARRGRLPTGSHVARTDLAQRGGASNDDEDDPPPPMRCAHRRPGNREICAHLELDRRRQDRLPDEPEPWARSGPRLF